MRPPAVMLLCVALIAGCSSSYSGITPPATVTLAVGARTSIQGTPWTLVFDSVVSDSRCPERVVCIQAGEALLALELASPMADPVPPDNPHFTLGATPVVIEGLRFTTVTVTPVSQVGEAIDPRSYRVTLRVEAVSGS